MSIALVKFGPGFLPLRAIFALAILGIVLPFFPKTFFRAILDVRIVLAIILAFAVLGIIASILSYTPTEEFTRQLLEIHVQAAVNLLVGACLVRLCGIQLIFRIFLAVVGLSTLVAALQFVGFSKAWDLRDFMQSMQPIDPQENNVFLSQRLRAMGLSFSPVHIGTQLCLLFAAGYVYLIARQNFGWRLRWSWHLSALITFCILGAVVSGNRSPLLGFLIFIALYLFRTKPAAGAFLFVTALPFLIYTDDFMIFLADAGLRVARTDDGSAEAREVLRVYGIQLFLDRPYGYGLSFFSPNYAQDYLHRLTNYNNYIAVTVHALHSYYLQILNKYGALVLVIAAWLFFRMARYPAIVMGFLPYAVHIFYHNDGPLQGDFLIWFIIPMYVRLLELLPPSSPRQSKRCFQATALSTGVT